MCQNPPRILIVDDEPDMCWVLENILCTANYAVTVTTNGADALDRVTDTSYALAFVDAKLPDIDGLELATLIRQQRPRMAIVLISGYFYPEDEAISRGLAENVIAGFIAKPFTLEEIRLLAQRAIAQTQPPEKEKPSNASDFVSGR